MDDCDVKRSEDFDATVARAKSVLLYTFEPKDVMATMMLQTSAEKWAKLAFDYVAVPASMTAVAKT